MGFSWLLVVLGSGVFAKTARGLRRQADAGSLGDDEQNDTRPARQSFNRKLFTTDPVRDRNAA